MAAQIWLVTTCEDQSMERTFYRISFQREKEPVGQNSAYSLEFLEFSSGTPDKSVFHLYFQPKSL